MSPLEFWQVFKKTELLPICRKLWNLKSQGKPCVLKETLEVLPNNYWGIVGGYEVRRWFVASVRWFASCSRSQILWFVWNRVITPIASGLDNDVPNFIWLQVQSILDNLRRGSFWRKNWWLRFTTVGIPNISGVIIHELGRHSVLNQWVWWV